MTLGSLFDGIGGWLLAAVHNGVTPIWSSEIEPFPCAVTAKHFPNTLQLGDITKLDGAELPPVDIVCAGSPCQNLSVAGNREGLKGAQSGLFLRAVDIVRRMRFATGGRYPRFFVWENVPGAFSSNRGMDFKAVLEEITEAEIPMPENNKWADAGMVEWDGGSLAWRVLDAQYWGVPQRRKRIFLVADLRGHSAGEILFERESVSRDIETGRETREGTAAGTENGIDGAIGVALKSGALTGNTACALTTEGRTAGATGPTVYIPDKARSLTARNDGSPCVDRGPDIVAAGFKAGAGADAGGLGYQVEQMPTLTSAESGTQRPTVAVYDMTHADEVMQKVPDGRAPTLNARMGTGGNQVPVLAFDTTQVTSPGNYSHPKPGDPCHPLCAGAHVPAVAYSIAGNVIGREDKNGGHHMGVDQDVSFTLNTVDRHAVCTYQKTCGSLCAHDGRGFNGQDVAQDKLVVAAYQNSGYGKYVEGAIGQTLQASRGDYGGGTETIVHQKTVRRLTPTECERLQGLPDGYTLIDDKTCSDTARYKALGNGMAQPCADYVIRRIVEVSGNAGQDKTDKGAN